MLLNRQRLNRSKLLSSRINYHRRSEFTEKNSHRHGFFEGVFIGSDKYPKLNALLEKLAEKYNVTPTTIASAWILRHPAKMQLISGSTSPKRIKEIAVASDITLTREEWYQLYLAAGHILP